MWKLIALILIAAVPGQSPEFTETADYRIPFPTEQACVEFKESDRAKAALAELQVHEEQQHAPAKVTITMECRQVERQPDATPNPH